MRSLILSALLLTACGSAPVAAPPCWQDKTVVASKYGSPDNFNSDQWTFGPPCPNCAPLYKTASFVVNSDGSCTVSLQ